MNPATPSRWPYGRYTYRGELTRLDPLIFVWPDIGGHIVRVEILAPDRETGEPGRVGEQQRVSGLESQEQLDHVVRDLLRVLLLHELDEGLLVDGKPLVEPHPELL